MSAIEQVSTKPFRSSLPASEQRVVLNGISWHLYKKILESVGERPALRLTFDGESLEVMTTSSDHEIYKKLLARMFEVITEELGIAIKSAGGFTFNRDDLERGIEPDECYYLAKEPLVRGKMSIDLSRDPPPDLAIEVEMSRTIIDRMAIYAAFGVFELWRFDGEIIRPYKLGTAGVYEECPRSPSLPFLRLDEIVDFLHQARVLEENTWIRTLRMWVRQHIAPTWRNPVD